MENRKKIALIDVFVRSYHYKNNKYCIFRDSFATEILKEDEDDSIMNNICKGINFFNPQFMGTKKEALRWIIDNKLSPNILGRNAFSEKSLMNAISLGCKQYLIFMAGYDTFFLRKSIPNLRIFELDSKEVIMDKKKRLDNYQKVNYIETDFTNNNWINSIDNSNFDKEKVSFCNMMGVSNYFSKDKFRELIENISKIVCYGSSIVFDYSNYSYQEIEKMLSNNGFLIYEHLDNNEITGNYFERYNTLNPNNKILSPKGVYYCLAIKK